MSDDLRYTYTNWLPNKKTTLKGSRDPSEMGLNVCIIIESNNKSFFITNSELAKVTVKCGELVPRY